MESLPRRLFVSLIMANQAEMIASRFSYPPAIMRKVILAETGRAEETFNFIRKIATGTVVDRVVEPTVDPVAEPLEELTAEPLEGPVVGLMAEPLEELMVGPMEELPVGPMVGRAAMNAH
jgi:hypothetical protein